MHTVKSPPACKTNIILHAGGWEGENNSPLPPPFFFFLSFLGQAGSGLALMCFSFLGQAGSGPALMSRLGQAHT
jgi:hypothetical protein